MARALFVVFVVALAAAAGGACHDDPEIKAYVACLRDAADPLLSVTCARPASWGGPPPPPPHCARDDAGAVICE